MQMNATALSPLPPDPQGIPSLALAKDKVQPGDDCDRLEGFTEWLGDSAYGRVARSQFLVTGMYCAACAGVIEQALGQLPGVISAQVNAAASRLQVKWLPERLSLDALMDAVRAAGYGAVPDAAAPARTLREREHRQSLWRLFVANFLMMQVMMLATPIYVAEPGDMAPDLLRLLNWGSWVLTLPVMFFSAGPFFRSAWQQLRLRRMGMDVPVSLGLLVTFVASSGATFEPGGLFGHEVYFDSLTMFVSFLLGGRYLELRARHRVARSLEDAMARLPDLVERIQADGRVDRVVPSRLRVGDLVRVPAGQGVPADGVLEQGETEVDESLLSGEAHAVTKRAGDELIAGSMNLNAPVLMRVQKVGPDTRYEGIVKMMREALAARPSELRLADRVAPYFLWVVLLLAFAAALVWHAIDPDRAVWVAVSVLIVTCPCALSLAAPSAWLASAGVLSRRGVLLARLDVLETLARVDTVVLDKTGTLTHEHMALVEATPGLPSDHVWVRRAISLATGSIHPVSRALCAAYAAGAQLDFSWASQRECPGQGIEAVDEQGRVWRLGAPAWAAAEPVVDMAAQLALGCDGRLLWSLRFDETLRDDAAQAVGSLRQQGLAVRLLSGDAASRVARAAQAAHIDDWTAAASPAIKREVVQRLQQQGHRVLMLGDGINDAPVLAQADASFAMGQGALVARAHADGIVLSGRLLDLAWAQQLALKTRAVIRQNLAWAAAYNAACIPLALLGYLPPWAAGIGMALSSLLVILNALRLGRFKTEQI